MDRALSLSLYKKVKKAKNNKPYRATSYNNGKKYKYETKGNTFGNYDVNCINHGKGKLSDKEINDGKEFDDSKPNHFLHDRTKWYDTKNKTKIKNQLRNDKHDNNYL